jgi:hypothetical protein
VVRGSDLSSLLCLAFDRTGNCDLKMLFMRLNLVTSSLLSKLEQRLDPVSLDWFIYPSLPLATFGFHRLDSFSWCSLDYMHKIPL